jgi:hypothetical protein
VRKMVDGSRARKIGKEGSGEGEDRRRGEGDGEGERGRNGRGSEDWMWEGEEWDMARRGAGHGRERSGTR